MTVIIDGCGTNMYSIVCALKRLGDQPIISADPNVIRSADRVILPGVGHAKFMMNRLIQRGLVPVIQELTQPVLGICLGFALLYEHSDEGDVPCLGLIPGRITRFPSIDLPLPHMGWNSLNTITDHPLMFGVQRNDFVYFVHSYIAGVSPHTIATSQYGVDFSAACSYRNFSATQFHPERSAQTGARILKNFLEMR